MGIYWKLFFCAYYTASALGEKTQPHVNAFYFTTLIQSVNLASIINLIHFFFPDRLIAYRTLYLLAFIVPAIINVVTVFFVNGGYKRQENAFKYLSSEKWKKERVKLLVLVSLITLALLGITGILNNP